MMWTCFQNTSGTSVSPTGPEVEPHVTGRPPPLSEPNRVLPGGRAHVLEDDVDAALVGGVKDRLRPLGIRRVVDAERRQDKGPVSGTSVLGTNRRPLPPPPALAPPRSRERLEEQPARAVRHAPFSVGTTRPTTAGKASHGSVNQPSEPAPANARR